MDNIHLFLLKPLTNNLICAIIIDVRGSRPHQEREADKMREFTFEGDNFTLDEKGVVRNCVGNVIMSDMARAMVKAGVEFSQEATEEARDAEVSEWLADYRKNYTGPSEEELSEMRANFGAGTVMVNAITGKRFKL